MLEIELPDFGLVPIPEIEAETSQDGRAFAILDLLALLAGSSTQARVSLVLAVQVEAGSRLMPDRVRKVRKLRLLHALLWPLLGTQAPEVVERARTHIAVDWACRWALPRALRVAGLLDEAQKPEVLAPIGEPRSVRHALAVVSELTRRLRLGFPGETRREIANAIRASISAKRALQAILENSPLIAAARSTDTAFFAGAADQGVWLQWVTLIDEQIDLTPQPERYLDAAAIEYLRSLTSSSST